MKALSDTPVARLGLRARLWFGARLLPFRIARLDLRQMLAAYDPHATELAPPFPPAHIARVVRWAVRKPIMMRDRRCLRSGLIGYAALQRSGYRPSLHFSVDPKSVASARIAAHCWVTLDGAPVINLPIEGHVLLFVHEASSRETVA